ARLLDHCIRVWGAVVKNLVHAYDPELVVLSGGVMRSADLIVEPLRAQVLSGVWAPWGMVELRVAAQPERSVLLGVHHLACART
ncbi:MAG TPA: ROK family protein, partial [Clostridia bacterium]|nr:ROK family protein [Clostridia bacterium]